ncbi:MAG: hypothetical protein HYV24_06645 [Deltaproteobacteria bacterium]|nr:hypothetical protein [Deltaproteobacteria bacterium]
MKTKPRIFIIESLRFSDEKKDLFEGKILSQILKISRSEAEYVYIRTKKELEKVIDNFGDSGYRYLHFSCHGNSRGIGLTLDDLSFEELGEILAPCLDKRRVFFSSCKVMNEKLAEVLLKGTGCYSVIGPSESINFDRAAIYWASFYHLMLRDEAVSMKREKLKEHTATLQKLFSIHMRYFSTSKSAKNGFKEVLLS